MLQTISSHHDRHFVLNAEHVLGTLNSSLHDGKSHLLLAASGTGATISASRLIDALSSYDNLSIRVVLTDAACRSRHDQSQVIPTANSLLGLPHVDGVYTDRNQWEGPRKSGRPVLHEALCKWTHLMVLAPLSANTMAKLIIGITDGLLTSIIRAWTPDWNQSPDTSCHTSANAPVSPRLTKTEGKGVGQEIQRSMHTIVAPAMTKAMWRHPITAKQLGALRDMYDCSGTHGDGCQFETVLPSEAELASADHEEWVAFSDKALLESIERNLLRADRSEQT